jgi:hypothetical protein
MPKGRGTESHIDGAKGTEAFEKNDREKKFKPVGYAVEARDRSDCEPATKKNEIPNAVIASNERNPSRHVKSSRCA